MKNDVSAFVEWFERERENLMDRLFKVLEENLYEELGCGLVMELHQEVLTAAAEQISRARADQKGSAAAVVPFLGYEQYRYSLVYEGSTGDPMSPASKKRRGLDKKRRDTPKTHDAPQLTLTNESEGLSHEGVSDGNQPERFLPFGSLSSKPE
ncbi:MAG TPA: hypothetical protein PKO23_10735 [Candidatus Hydrogenedentes bacterium]|jgi:hypothetical protein|nr:hypothetical protein [Candidatus Hydrogenedentota bacterium]